MQPFPDPRLPNLDFRPTSLSTSFLLFDLFFYTSVTALLLWVYVLGEFEFTNIWLYFLFTLLPQVLGTITNSLIQGAVLALYRIYPFISCANHDAGAQAGETIFGVFFPLVQLTALFATRDWMLITAYPVVSASFFALGFKSTLLTIYQDFQDDTPFYAVYVWNVGLWCLVCCYVVLIVYVLALLAYFRKWPTTGLRWDVVSIADHLALFRHSPFLDDFAGSAVATRKSMVDRLGRLKIRLGYWRLGSGEIWHGFGVIQDHDGPQQQQGIALEPMGQETSLPIPRRDPVDDDGTREEAAKVSLTKDTLASLRYGPLPTRGHTFPWSYLSIIPPIPLFIILVQHYARTPFTIPLTADQAAVVFLFVPTVIASYCTENFEHINIQVARTQPFVSLSQSRGGIARDTLFQNYSTLPRTIMAYEAFLRGHWHVCFSAVMAMAYRLVPIILPSIYNTFKDEHDSSKSRIVESSIEGVWATLIALIICIVILVVELMWGNQARLLPRQWATIGDLISWTCTSPILRDDRFNGDQGNPLDLYVTEFIHDEGAPGSSQSLSLAEKEKRASDPVAQAPRSSSTTQDEEEEEWHPTQDRNEQQLLMESRVRILRQTFSFGVTPLYNQRDGFTLGIGLSSDMVTHLDPPPRLSRNRPKPSTQKFWIPGVENFAILGPKSRHDNTAGEVPTPTQTAQVDVVDSVVDKVVHLGSYLCGWLFY